MKNYIKKLTEHSPIRYKRAFTLVELIIVLIIVAILSTIAIPLYTDQVRKGRRVDGTATLLNIASEQEKHRANNATYGTLAAVWGTSTSPQGYYQLNITSNSATGYTATATAQGDQANDDEQGISCTTLSLIVNGLSTTRTPNTCW